MQRLFQIAIVVGALIFGIYLVQSGAKEEAPLPPPAATESPSMVMLQTIEGEIAKQEDIKDVRCWSSVNKIQTFISGMPVELEANGQRVERYVELIEEVWQASSESKVGPEIESDVLVSVLKSKFPANVTVAEEVAFEFGSEFGSLKDLNDSMKDYRDTIESWRLLQSWALRKASQESSSENETPFSSMSILQFREFLVAFDLGLLKACKSVAMERKLGSIDSKTVDIAFDRMLAGESATLKDN